MTMLPPSMAMPLSPSTCWMSTSMDGMATRKFIAGTRLWPPASTIASRSLARNAIASSSVRGASYRKQRRLHLQRPSHYACIHIPNTIST